MSTMVAAPPYAVHQSERFAVIEVVEETFREHVKFCESLKADGYEAPVGVVFQYDGQCYGPLEPGQRMTLPLTIAAHGIKATMGWTQKDGPDGQPRRNFRAKAKPMLRIVEELDPNKLGEMMMRGEAATPALCPYCSAAVPAEQLRGHIDQRFANGGICPGAEAGSGSKEPEPLRKYREKKAAEAEASA